MSNHSVEILRQSIRQARRQLGVGARYRAAKYLVDRFRSMEVYHASQHVAFYIASDGELSCRFLIKQAWKDGKDCYLPVLNTKHSDPPMSFARYRPGDILQKNRYGILEPANPDRVKASALDLVVVPLVAFDSKGNRVGMGGGYYDRSFAFKQAVHIQKYKQSAPYLVGAAHRLQKVSKISSESWDVGLDKVVTV